MKNNILKSLFISLILLVGTSNVWAYNQSAVDLYFDNSEAKWSSCYVYIGHSTWTSCYPLTRVSGTQYLWKLAKADFNGGSAWNGATGWVLCNEKWWDSNGESIDKYTWHGAKNVTKKSTSAWSASYIYKTNGTVSVTSDGNTINAYNTTTVSNKSYTVTIKTATGGTLTVKDYDNNAVASGASKIHLTVLKFSASASTGYTFGGVEINDGTNTTTITAANIDSETYTLTSTVTITPIWTENTYSLTFKHDGNGSIKVGGTTINSGSTASVNHVTTKTLVATPNTGYNFSSWSKSGSNASAVTIGSTSSSSTTIKATAAGATVTANFTPKTYTITLDKNGGTSNGQATATYNSSSITNITHPTRTDYRCNGYYTAASGGTLVLNTDGTLAKSVSGYTDANGNWTKDDAATLYAQWTYDVTEYTVTFGAGTGFTSYGSVTAYNNTTSASITSPATVLSGQSITFTATPQTGYEVEGWYTNAACTEGKHDAGSTTYNTSIIAATNVYVKFVEKKWSVTFAAGNGGSVTTPSSTSQTVGQLAGITIIAETNEGYTFAGWTSSNGGSFNDAEAEGTTFYPTAATTVTASFSENTYAITVKSNNENFGTVSPESGTAGVDTKFTITATPKLGYRFVNWTAPAGITLGDANSPSTTVNATTAGTVTANFEEITPTTIYVKSNGTVKDFKWNYNSVAYDMTPMYCGGTYYTANILGGIDEITLTGSNDFNTTTLTVPQDENVLYDLTSTKITHLYLKPNSNWTSSSAWFAAYFFGNGDKWVKMLDEDGDGIYSCEIPTDKTYPSVIFVRMNSAKSALSWDSKWDQTNDLTVQTDGKNLYTVAAGAWSNGDGSWSAHYDNSRWTTFEAPALNVQVNITGKGSIVIDGEAYSSNTTGKETLSFTKPSGETITIGAITAVDHWALTSSQITICDKTFDLAASHTISGPATINLTFTQTHCEVVYNLQLPQGAEHPAIDAQTIEMNGVAVEPAVQEVNDHLFGGWYKEAACTNKYDFSKAVTGDITIYAKWIPYSQCIFFKNTLGWSNVYVYTFNDDMWHKGDNQEDAKDDKGVQPKVNKIETGKMTQIGQTDVYYYVLTNLTGFKHIAFSEKDMAIYDFFYDSKAVYRIDRSDQMPLFIPQKDQSASTYNSTKYYNSGLWMKYNSTESGYNWRSDKNGWNANANYFTASSKGGYTFTALVTLEGGTDYKFKTAGLDANKYHSWFGYNGTLTQEKCTDLHFKSDLGDAKIHPTVSGDYLFTIYLGDGKMMVTLDYPLGIGDFRLVYKDNTPDYHPSRYIKHKAEGSNDTISFFIHSDKEPQVIVQKCTGVTNDGAVTWEDVNIGDVNPAASITESGVYNFVLQQIEGQENPILVAQARPYTGNYYIRTDVAAGGWDAFRQDGNKMTYTSKSDDYDYYFCEWITSGRNVKFTIANDYSLCISDTIDGDAIIGNTGQHIGYLQADANVRFTWDSKTNELSRAYIAGATDATKNTFLHIIDAVSLKNTNGASVTDVPFVDVQNWIYQTEVRVSQDTRIQLVAEYNGKTQYFRGGTGANDKIALISSTANSEHKVRLVYDFKCDHLVAAVVLDGNKEFAQDDVLGADLMVMRKDQGQAEQLTFNPNNKKLSGVGEAYSVMTFTKDHITNQSLKARERSLYWVSFPFDVKIADVFGFGEYAEHWIMQYYDGAERAAKGLFSDSGSYWKYITDTTTTLKAGVGYVLVLDLDKITFPKNVNELSLYFPSTGEVGTISGELPTAYEVPAHECTIDREFVSGGKIYNHKFTDSHWNLIGVPGFADIEDFNVRNYHFMQDDASFFYNFDLSNSTYSVASAATNFQAMHAYMVQFAGTINWMSKTVSGVQPKELAARRNSDGQAEKLTLCLELAQEDKTVDQTFIQLQEEGATTDFDLSKDLSKIINKGSNIYTLVGADRIETAGNALPMQEHIVPIGIVAATTGEYTFCMPEGTEGMVVELIDFTANTRTNLLFLDYTVELTAGTYENRFALHIQPEKSGVATDIEQMMGGESNTNGVQKFIIDGRLYLKKDGILYDAQGRYLHLSHSK